MNRFSDVLDRLKGLSTEDIRRLLRQLGLLQVDEERETDDQEEQEQELAATGITVAERVEDLKAEVQELERLIKLTIDTWASASST